MSSFEAQKQRQELETRALTAEQKTRAGNSHNVQLENAISAAELYMQALRLADDPITRKRLDLKTKELILKAEECKKLSDSLVTDPKAATWSSAEYPTCKRKLTTRESIILLEGSKLNGALFKPWTTTPSADEFEVKHGQNLFTDRSDLSLSESQMKHFAGWRRAGDAVALVRRERDGHLLPHEATMAKLGTWDLVQDVAPDCSVVASMCVEAAREDRGHRKVRLVGDILPRIHLTLSRSSLRSSILTTTTTAALSYLEVANMCCGSTSTGVGGVWRSTISYPPPKLLECFMSSTGLIPA